MKYLTEQDYKEAAQFLGCDVPTIKAVAKVESLNSGFYRNGEPKILFEGHIFHKLTNGKYSTSENADISYPKWKTRYYRYNQHKRLQKAVKLDRDAALKSASWGKFQIMGFNHKLAGFNTLQEFVNAMYRSEKEHLKAFVNYVKNRHLDDELRNHDWVRFAYYYNGPGFAKNRYDEKLAYWYDYYKKRE